MAARFKAAFGQRLLDLVKAFKRVTHHILQREGISLGYPLQTLVLSLLAYPMPRTVRVRLVFSRTMVGARGITAGSGTATT